MAYMRHFPTWSWNEIVGVLQEAAEPKMQQYKVSLPSTAP